MEEIEGTVGDVVFFVNGNKVDKCLIILWFLYHHFSQVTLNSPDPEMTLLYFLRNNCK